VALALLALGVGATGCGEAGVSSGATVHAYVGAPLCAGAKRELAKHGAEAGDVRVRMLCLVPVNPGGRLDLATIGANARRATEDSTAIAYAEPPGPANRFSRTILEEAGIAWTTATSGATAMRRIIDAVSEAGSGSLRDKVREALESS
jgi:D-alanyl-D-alanine carboxypeptidase